METNDNDNDTATHKDRSPVYLIEHDIPYSDMTETELDAMVEYKARRKAEASALKESAERQRKLDEELLKTRHDTSEHLKNSFDAFIAERMGTKGSADV